MGDVLTLVEKAEAAFTEEQARELEEKFLHDSFGLDDYLEQLTRMRSMGPLDQILGMIPGMGSIKNAGAEVDEGEVDRMVAIINSMTPAERRDPSIINGSRRRRIAVGSGRNVQDVNRLLKNFGEMRRMMRQFADIEHNPKARKRLSRMPFFNQRP